MKRWRWSALLAAAAVLSLPGCLGGDDDAPLEQPPEAQGDVAGKRVRTVEPFFAPSSFWNRRLPRDAPIDARSAALVAELRRQVAEHGATLNTTVFSVPVYRVGPDQPRVPVALDRGDSPSLTEALSEVPLPEDAEPAAGSDGTLVVWQPSTDTMWEFWRLRREGGGWRAGFGGRLLDVSEGPGLFRDRDDPVERSFWGAAASGLPRAGGLVRLQELRQGRIDHALAIAIPEPRSGVWAAPATRTDGISDSRTAIPEGARFRIDPDVDLGELDLSPVGRMLARAAQMHGIVVQNRAGAVAFYGEDPSRLEEDPYPDLLRGTRPYELGREFPWRHLELIRMDLEP